MNIEETNKLIAEFMGAKLGDYKREELNYNSSNESYWDVVDAPDSYLYNGEIYYESEFEFNSSWDWLIPVAEKYVI